MKMGFCERDNMVQTLSANAADDAVADAKTGGFLARKGIDELLGRRCGAGIYGNVEVNGVPPIVTEHDEDVQA